MRDLMKVVDYRYHLPSRKYFSNTCIPKMYSECRGKLEQKLANVSYYATTSDLLSSRTSEPYLSLTVYYMTSDWKLRSSKLQATYFPDHHTGEVIAQGLKDALHSWRLKEENMTSKTTDSGTLLNQLHNTSNKGSNRHRVEILSLHSKCGY